MPSELEVLRREVRDLRYVAEAALLALVGKDRRVPWQMEARVQRHLERTTRGTPLAEVGIRGDLREWLESDYRDGQDIVTVEELVQRWPRSEFASMKGVGSKTLERIDEAIAGKGLWEAAWRSA